MFHNFHLFMCKLYLGTYLITSFRLNFFIMYVLKACPAVLLYNINLTHAPVQRLHVRCTGGKEIRKKMPAISCAAPHETYAAPHSTCRPVHTWPQPGHITLQKKKKKFRATETGNTFYACQAKVLNLLTTFS